MGKHRYGVILDAGSSGTRVYIYKWLDADVARKHGDAKSRARLPEIKMVNEKKVHPGVSTYGEFPERVGDGLEKLVHFAAKHVPEDEIKKTPIFLLATAGMRLLPQVQREAVLQSICSYFKQNTQFQLPDCDLHVQVIPGETEGLYGWIAANYLLGGFDSPDIHDHGKDHHTYGFLDMGGASAQIAFAPNVTEAELHANDLKMLRLRRVSGEPLEYRIFVTTWLGFGANEARRRYVEKLLETYPGEAELPDPCLPVGLKITKTGVEVIGTQTGDDDPHLLGTGKFAECLLQTNPLLGKDKPCLDKPCLLNGIHTPAIDFDVNHFVGVSEFWHTTHEVFAMAHKDKAYDFATYQKQVTEFCSQDWQSIRSGVADHKWGKKVDEKTVEEVCFKASWLISVLHDGIGVPRYGLDHIEGSDSSVNQTKKMLDNAKHRGFLDPFQAVDKIEGEEVSWTLGKMVLYASSQIPPTTNTTNLLVGFGSNRSGSKMLSDFERPGGTWTTQGSSDIISDDDTEWHDQILSAHYSRRVPGILIFLLILVLAVYLLCGRERRNSIVHKILTILGRTPKSGLPRIRRRKGPPGLLSSALFSNNHEPSYERVLENADPDDFELGSIASPSTMSPGANSGAVSELRPTDGAVLDRPRTGRTSGWATPANRCLSPDFTRSSPKGKGYFDGLHGGAAPAPGLGITPFERGGLNARTESRECLALAPRDSRSRSRLGSPTRRSPMLTPLIKESID